MAHFSVAVTQASTCVQMEGLVKVSIVTCTYTQHNYHCSVILYYVMLSNLQRFIKNHGGKVGNMMLLGWESNTSIWQKSAKLEGGGA